MGEEQHGALELAGAPGSLAAAGDANTSAPDPLKSRGARRAARKPIKQEKLSILSKICFAVGGIPNQVSSSASAFFLQIYLLDIAKISPYETSIVMSLGKAWGGITDPVVGYFINKSKWTRIGRLMPWMIGCTPFMIVSYFLLWFVPPFQTGRVFWYLTFYSLYQALTTCFHVPYSTLTMFLSTEQIERDSATAYRMTMEVLGTLIGAALQGQIVASAHKSDHCIWNNITEHIAPNGTYLLRTINNSTEHLQNPDFDSHAKNVYMLAAGIIGGMYLICAVVLFLGVRERDDPYVKISGKVISFCTGFKLAMRHRPFVSLTASFLFISAAVQLEQNIFVLFCTHAAGLRDHFQYLVLTILISAVLSIPFWQWVLQRCGKKMAAFGISWMIPFGVTLATIPSLIIAYVVAVTAGLSIAATLLLPWSMLPDVIDDFRLQNLDIKGAETVFYSTYVFFTRISAGIALGISTLFLEFSGYQSGACKQSKSVITTLKILTGAVPAIMIVIGLLILTVYPISEKRRRETAQLLDMMRSRSRRLTLIG